MATQHIRGTQTHVFAPSTFQLVFSAAIPPVLRIRPGDTVRTSTLDNKGFDANLVCRSRPGNPLTGPFYVDGARRGDILAIRFDSIYPNRDTAHSGARLVPGTVTNEYHERARYDFPRTDWHLDRERGVARPEVRSERLKNYEVRIHPFLGCVGVAPLSNQAFGPTRLGPWGGNLDYNRLREGTTLYLPVFQTGALLSLGDGHAAQGDGEITGDAIETSMDVVFTVDVVTGDATDDHLRVGVRARSHNERMAFGISTSMRNALRLATTSLAEWIARDYHLSENETALVLGTAVTYDVAEVVDPKVNIVARISESVLSTLRAG